MKRPESAEVAERELPALVSVKAWAFERRSWAAALKVLRAALRAFRAVARFRSRVSGRRSASMSAVMMLFVSRLDATPLNWTLGMPLALCY
jgi:hypothetical protein